MAYDDEFYRFRPTKKVEGGIKARAKRFGESWWSAGWLETSLKDSRSTNRLARGRSYARRGQILDFQVDSGLIKGSIQGSEDLPYAAEITAERLSPEKADRILRQMQKSPLFAARLLNQEMPVEVKTLFEAEGENLFPGKLRMRCSCPDEVRICKHLAALCYLFALELERDPLLLLQLRGIDRNNLLSESRSGDLFLVEMEDKPEALPAEPVKFWRGARLPVFTADARAPEQNALLLRQLGNFPMWRGETDAGAFLESVYEAASSHALKYLDEK